MFEYYFTPMQMEVKVQIETINHLNEYIELLK